MKFLCPNCSGEQHCPCENCKERNKDKITWIWITVNGPIECGHCGHTMSFGEWLMEEFKQYDVWKEENKQLLEK